MNDIDDNRKLSENHKQKDTMKDSEIERIKLYELSLFLPRYIISQYPYHNYITTAHNTLYTAIALEETTLSKKIVIIIFHNIYNTERKHISFKKHRTIKYEHNDYEEVQSEFNFPNNNDKDNEPELPKKFLYFVCDNCLLLEIDMKKIILINFKHKQFTTLYNNTSSNKTIHIINTYDEYLNVAMKRIDSKAEQEYVYLTRSYVFIILEEKLYFFLLHDYIIDHCPIVYYTFPIEETNIKQVIIERCKNESNTEQWYYIFMFLVEERVVRYITDWTDMNLKNYFLKYQKDIKPSQPMMIYSNYFGKKGKYSHIKLVQFEGHQSHLILHVDKNISIYSYLNNLSLDQLKRKFELQENITNNIGDNSLISSVINSPSFTGKKHSIVTSIPHLNLDKSISDNTFQDDFQQGSLNDDIFSHTLPEDIDYSQVIINLTQHHICIYLNKTFSIFDFRANCNNDPDQEIFRYTIEDTPIHFINYTDINCLVLLQNNRLLRLRWNISLYELVDQILNTTYDTLTVRGDDVYQRLEPIFRFLDQKANMRSCDIHKEYIKCEKCNKMTYCSEEQMEQDYTSNHFFECELIQLSKRINNEASNQEMINYFMKTVKKILRHIFTFIKNNNDYQLYIIYLKLILMLFKITKINCEIESAIRNQDDMCHKIFCMELLFTYYNIQLLYITFGIKANLLSEVKSMFFACFEDFLFLRHKKEAKASLFASFGFMNNNKTVPIDSLNSGKFDFCPRYFFELKKYSSANGLNLDIYNQFFKYYLYTNGALLKLSLFLLPHYKQKDTVDLANITMLASNMALVIEDKYKNYTEANEIKREKNIRLMIPLIYFYISFSVIKIEKFQAALKILQGILKMVSIDNYIHFEAIIYYNIGLIYTFIGKYDIGIHNFEQSLRFAFENSLSSRFTMKIYDSLILAYININKPETAFCMIKEALELAKKINYSQHSIQKLLKLKMYLIYLLDLIAYQFNSLQIEDNKEKYPSFVSKENDTSLPQMKQKLLSYIMDENKERILKEISCKYDVQFLEVLEFFSNLSVSQLEKLNEDNKAFKVQVQVKENDANNDKTIISESNTLNVSTSMIGGNKEGPNQILKDEEEIAFEKEIEIKINVYDELEQKPRRQLLQFDTKLFLRSNILRDPKGIIDRFNINYHPIFSYDYFAFLEKLSENYLLKKINNFGIIDNRDDEYFNYKPGDFLLGLRKFCNLEKIRNLLHIEIVKRKHFRKGNNIKSSIKNKSETCLEWTNSMKQKLEKKKIDLGYLDDAFEEIYNILSEEECAYIKENPEQLYNYIYSDIHNKVVYKDISNDINKDDTQELNSDKDFYLGHRNVIKTKHNHAGAATISMEKLKEQEPKINLQAYDLQDQSNHIQNQSEHIKSPYTPENIFRKTLANYSPSKMSSLHKGGSDNDSIEINVNIGKKAELKQKTSLSKTKRQYKFNEELASHSQINNSNRKSESGIDDSSRKLENKTKAKIVSVEFSSSQLDNSHNSKPSPIRSSNKALTSKLKKTDLVKPNQADQIINLLLGQNITKGNKEIEPKINTPQNNAIKRNTTDSHKDNKEFTIINEYNTKGNQVSELRHSSKLNTLTQEHILFSSNSSNILTSEQPSSTRQKAITTQSKRLPTTHSIRSKSSLNKNS